MRPTHGNVAVALLGLAAILIVGCDDSTGPPAPTTGAIEVTVSTEAAGPDTDPDGYTLSIDGRPSRPIGVNSVVTIGALPSGTYVVRLLGLATHCSVRGMNPVSINVIAGRPATPVSFAVSCGSGDSGAGDWDY